MPVWYASNMISPIIEGKVIKGDGYGKKLGFPTANLDRKQFLKDKMNFPLGIYAGVAYLHHINKIRKAAIVIGPLDKKNVPKIEAHILGFKGKIYGKKLTLYLYKFLRPFETFKNEKLLIAQIKKDVKRVEKEVATPVNY
jgi:FAD synthase